MSEFVLDNSVVMTWCFVDEADDYTDSVLTKLVNGRALVPSVWPLELGNALVVAERKKRISSLDVLSSIALVRTLPIVITHEPAERILDQIVALARENSLTTYDASYLDLAIRLNLPLATKDVQLRKAAEKLGVAEFQPV